MTDNITLIKVQNVGVRFASRNSLFNRDYIKALRDVSFELRRGDSLGVVGRNGAGKSTLLRLLGGIIQPDSGKIINNKATTSLLSLQVGFDLELPGRINAILSGMMLGFRKHEVEAKLEKIIAFSELGDFIDRPVKSYSTGMKARLGFSVALELNPDVLLIDEVLGVGDAEFRKKSMEVMKEKLLSDQTTIVLVSHSADTVKNLCNRAVWIEDGVTRMEGASKDVVTAYENFLMKNDSPKHDQMSHPGYFPKKLKKVQSKNLLNKVKIFGIGFHNTEINFLAAALRTLGFNVTGPNGVKNPNIRNDVHQMAHKLVEKHDAFLNNPWPILYKELDQRYPGSKFILTMHPTDEWIANLVQNFGKNTTPMREWIYGVGCPEGNEQIYIDRYERHNKEVLEYFKSSPDDLLVLNISEGDGWEKLCPFLSKEIPNIPFPYKKKTP